MAVNSSSSFFSDIQDCSKATGEFAMTIAFMITNFSLLLPLCLFVLYLGHQRWRRQSTFATSSHSDVFTYHFAAMELIFSVGTMFYLIGTSFGLPMLMIVGYYATFTFYPGLTTFHVLTCFERYLAVVFPVIYLRLRQSGGIRIRNITICCAWLIYCGWVGVAALYFPNIPYIPTISVLVLSLVVVSFCSISVLCVLIRAGPGEQVADGKSGWVAQSKQRAFTTIMAITGVQWFFFLGVFGCLGLQSSHLLSYDVGCLVLMSGNWFSFPSTLVLPLLFLHRAGKLVCCHCSND